MNHANHAQKATSSAPRSDCWQGHRLTPTSGHAMIRGTMTWDGKRFEIDEIETHDGKRTVWHEYWTDITPTSFVQSGDVTQPDGTTVRFMSIRGPRVKKLESLHGI